MSNNNSIKGSCNTITQWCKLQNSHTIHGPVNDTNAIGVANSKKSVVSSEQRIATPVRRSPIRCQPQSGINQGLHHSLIYVPQGQMCIAGVCRYNSDTHVIA